MSVHHGQIQRQSWPKRQPRRSKPPARFAAAVKALMAARSGGICEIDSCGAACQYHHRGPTGAGGSRLEWVNRAANGLHVSMDCHLKAEGRLKDWPRRTSRDNGWLVSRNGHRHADEVPVLYRGEWVLLDDQGGITPIGGDAA